MFEGLDLDTKDQVSEEEEHDSEESEGAKDEADAGVECTSCDMAIAKPILLSVPYVGPKKLKIPRSPKMPYCLDCGIALAKTWLVAEGNGKLLESATPAQERELVITSLVDHLIGHKGNNIEEMRLLADHFKFCRGCHDINAHVEAPGQPCDVCRDMRRCRFCDRSRRLVHVRGRTSIGDNVCAYCYNKITKRRAAEGGGAIPVDPERGAGLGPMPPLGKCIECSGPAKKEYCLPCKKGLQDLPGLKCEKCRIQLRPEGHTLCLRCQMDKRESRPVKRLEVKALRRAAFQAYSNQPQE
ncbi:hypothetical protein C8A00DRAFT_13225 [Chaetomidium leptoderma]|uniref:Uncharacterized protein n=1 Tax=Chaetomidium leptoderma TaxID=669021 RepID=A0AAN6ZXL6_9PEZI|nr:hypothetical protein C8A00DRAFT_13225 [Chaetomidium leptoderma]